MAKPSILNITIDKELKEEIEKLTKIANVAILTCNAILLLEFETNMKVGNLEATQNHLEKCLRLQVRVCQEYEQATNVNK